MNYRSIWVVLHENKEVIRFRAINETDAKNTARPLLAKKNYGVEDCEFLMASFMDGDKEVVYKFD